MSVEAFGSLADGRIVGCVDIGGTKVSVTLADSRGFVARQVEPTVREGPSEALAGQVIRLLEATCRQAGIPDTRLAAIGVASCGPFMQTAGRIALASPNLCGGLAGPGSGLPNDWRAIPLETPLRARFDTLRITNDAVAALEAERRWGALRDVSHCAYLTWSTGVGAALCVDDRVLHGRHGNAGHAGHLFVDGGAADARCGCGNLGDVEGQAGGASIRRRFGIEPATLFGAARRGDREAKRIVDSLIRVVGRTLYDLAVLLDLERIALGGGIFWHHRDWLLPGLQGELAGRFPLVTDDLALVPAGLGAEVGDYGALALVA
jgi:glucokinase